jgi:hypothetical protein
MEYDPILEQIAQFAKRTLESVYIGTLNDNDVIAFVWADGIVQTVCLLDGARIDHVIVDNAVGVVAETHAFFHVNPLVRGRVEHLCCRWKIHLSLQGGEVVVSIDWHLSTHPFMSIIAGMPGNYRMRQLDDGDHNLKRARARVPDSERRP